MRYPLHFLLIGLAAAIAPAPAAGQLGMWMDRAGGLGLRPDAGGTGLPADGAFSTGAAHAWQAMRGKEFALYGGTLETARLGLRAPETLAGIVQSRGAWGYSFEVSHSNAAAFAPQRYALGGQIHTSLTEGRTLSVGLKYRVQEPDSAQRYGLPGDMTGPNGYSLTGPRAGSYSPGYQVQMSYQYSAAGALGLAVGREVETFTPFLDSAAASGPRQFSLTGQHWVTPSWALSYDILSQDVATPLRVQGLRLGVRYRF